MITALHLGNFKAFADTQRIPIKPLTLIFGPNSSGKSSIIHGLLLAQQAAQTGNMDVHKTTVGGECVDLGGFRQFLHRQQRDAKLEIGFEVSVKFTKETTSTVRLRLQYGLLSKAHLVEYGIVDSETGRPDGLVCATGEQLWFGPPLCHGYEVEVDGKVLLRAKLERGFPDQAIKEFLKASQQDFAAAYSKLAESRHLGLVRGEFVDCDHPWVSPLIEEAVTEMLKWPGELNDREGLRKRVCELLPEAVTFDADKLIPDQQPDWPWYNPFEISDPREPAKFYSDLEENLRELIAFEGATVESSGPPSVAEKSQAQKERSNIFRGLASKLEEFLARLAGETKGRLECVRYLGPLRSYPARHFAFSEHVDPNWNAGGGAAWDMVRRDATVLAKVNQWLGNRDKLSTPYALKVRHLLTIDDLEPLFVSEINHLEQNFFELVQSGAVVFAEIEGALGGMRRHQAELSSVQELSLVDQRTGATVSSRDVGVGISQVLPVLVAAYGTRNTIHAIEQPEIHLHPALQAELGDVFIESALGENKNTFLIETHSEHLILRILRRIRESTRGKHADRPAITPDDVALLYVEPTKHGSVVKPLRVDDHGRLIDRCPGGFFEEDFAELF